MIKKNAEALLGLEEAAERRLRQRKEHNQMSSAKTGQKSSGKAYNWENIPSEVVRPESAARNSNGKT